ncbi:hypothetical protein C1I97_35270, partial [Streptomyces sp. NTH33]
MSTEARHAPVPPRPTRPAGGDFGGSAAERAAGRSAVPPGVPAAGPRVTGRDTAVPSPRTDAPHP